MRTDADKTEQTSTQSQLLGKKVFHELRGSGIVLAVDPTFICAKTGILRPIAVKFKTQDVHHYTDAQFHNKFSMQRLEPWGQNAVSRTCFNVIHTSWFSTMTMGFILINAVVLACGFWNFGTYREQWRTHFQSGEFFGECWCLWFCL